MFLLRKSAGVGCLSLQCSVHAGRVLGGRSPRLFYDTSYHPRSSISNECVRYAGEEKVHFGVYMDFNRSYSHHIY